MSPACNGCDSHVSHGWVRVASDGNGDVHACPDCAVKYESARRAAGLNPETHGVDVSTAPRAEK